MVVQDADAAREFVRLRDRYAAAAKHHHRIELTFGKFPKHLAGGWAPSTDLPWLSEGTLHAGDSYKLGYGCWKPGSDNLRFACYGGDCDAVKLFVECARMCNLQLPLQLVAEVPELDLHDPPDNDNRDGGNWLAYLFSKRQILPRFKWKEELITCLAWESGNKHNLPLFNTVEDSEPLPALPAMDARQEVFTDYRTAGLSLKAHPISFFRQQLNKLQVVTAAKLASLKDGRFVRVGGLVLVRQRPGTAKGITFVTLEDETGVVNLIVRMDVWEKFYTVARTAPAFIASGRLQNQQGVIHVLVSRLENLN